MRLLEAAKTEFAEHGYAATTVTRLAATAGVSVQTLYLSWGSKRELLRGLVEHALGGVPDAIEDAELFRGLLPEQIPARLAHLVADIAARAAPAWHLYRDAAAVDPEIAEDWDELQLLRRGRIASIVDRIPDSGLHAGLSRDAAVDTAWTIASPESYELLVRRLGYGLDRFRSWLAATLEAVLLDPR